MTVSNSNQLITHSKPLPPSQQKTDIWEIWERMWRSKQLIIFSTCLFILGGLLYNFLTAPVYTADTLLQIEQLKDASTGAELGDDLTLERSVSPFTAEQQILLSRSVLGSAVDQYQLDIDVRPKILPLLDQAIERSKESTINANNETEAPGNWLTRNLYAWGAGKIQVSNFEIPPQYLDKDFIVTTLADNLFQLSDMEQSIALLGHVGEPASITNSAGQTVSITVAALQSKAGKEFLLVRQNRVDAVNSLRDQLRISELGKDSGIVKLELLGNDREKTVQILSSITDTYLQKKREAKTAVVQNNLNFLDERLPAVKQDLERSEEQLNAFRLDRGSVDFNAETESTLSRIVTIETTIQELNLARQDLRTRFTAQHPNITSLDAQIELLRQELEQLESTVNKLPQDQQKYLSLSRNVDVNTTLYTALLGRAQELEIAQASATSDISVLDPSTAETEPVKPKKLVTLLIASLMGGMVGILLSIFKDSMVKGVEDPEELEQQLSIPVIAAIPQSVKQLSIDKHAAENKSDVRALAHIFPNDPSVESLRNLRSTLFFREDESSNNAILITSASPEVGKSFISLNLAIVLANSGKSVVLVDADMRRGRLHKAFYTDRAPGLSEVIEISLLPGEVVRPTSISGLSFVGRGLPPENPSDLLFANQFLAFIEILSANYDHVIIDAPPVLAAPDAGIIGNSVGSTLLVVKSGVNPIREIAQCKKQLAQNSVELTGIIFNNILMTSKSKSYGGYVYQYATDDS